MFFVFFSLSFVASGGGSSVVRMFFPSFLYAGVYLLVLFLMKHGNRWMTAEL